MNSNLKNILLEHCTATAAPYADLQLFSAEFDKKMGFDIDRVEEALINKALDLYPEGSVKSWGKALYEGSEAWIGLNPDQLQTTYFEFYEAIRFINPKEGQVFCDLGAGYGRLGVLISLLYEGIIFTGIEIVEERVNDAKKVFESNSFSNCSLTTGKLGKVEIPFANYYFLYDFGSVSEIDSVLEQLAANLKVAPVVVIARGRGVRSIINNKHQWLSQIYQNRINSFAIYSSVPK